MYRRVANKLRPASIAASVAFAPLNPIARAQALAATRYFADALTQLSPNTGAYVNEVNSLLIQIYVYSRS
jgi:hypothetical protein